MLVHALGNSWLLRGLLAVLWLISASWLPAAAASPASTPPRIGLVIANASYVRAGESLPGARRDGRTIKDALEQVGFRVTLVSDATKPQIEASITAFQRALRDAGPTAVGLIYYAGHGSADSARSDNYLLPVDIDSIASAEIASRGVGVRWITDLLRHGDPRPAVAVVIDACRSVAPETGRGTASPRGSTTRVVDMIEPDELPDRGYLIAFSTSKGRIASDGGHFAEALAAKLVSRGLTLDQVFEQVRQNVGARTEQLPTFRSTLVDKVCLAGCEGAARADTLNILLEASRTFSRGEIGQTSALEELIAAGRTFERSELFQGVSFRDGKRLSKLKATGANFKITDLSGSDLSEAKINDARLQAVTAVGTIFDASVLDGSYLPIAVAPGARFDKASLKRTAWLGADLQRASFRGANLRGASFRLADLRQADFSGADLTNATFNGADLRDALFTGATLSNTNFDSALIRRNALTASQTKGACETIDGYGGIQLVMIASKSSAYSRTYLDLESADPGIGWKNPGTRLPQCLKVSHEELPKAYDSRIDSSPVFSIHFPEELLEVSGNKGELYDRLHQRLHKSIVDRMRAAHAMGWSLRCPFGFDFGGDCVALRKEGLAVE